LSTNRDDQSFNEDQVREKVLQEAQRLHIDLQPEQVKVRRIAQEIVIWADYTVHIDVPYHPFDLEFHPASKNKRSL
jgi:sensor domain CHASE-containing protein